MQTFWDVAHTTNPWGPLQGASPLLQPQILSGIQNAKCCLPNPGLGLKSPLQVKDCIYSARPNPPETPAWIADSPRELSSVTYDICKRLLSACFHLGPWSQPYTTRLTLSASYPRPPTPPNLQRPSNPCMHLSNRKTMWAKTASFIGHLKYSRSRI